MTTDESGQEEFTPGLGNIPPAAHEDYGPEPHRRWPWIVGAIVVGLAALIAFGPALLSTGWLNDRVRSYLNDNLEEGVDVDFRRLSVSWLEGIRLFELEVRHGARDTHPLLHAPLVEFEADVLPLLVRRLDVRKFVFHDPVVRIERTREGTLNAEDVVRTRKKKRKDEDGGDKESLVLPPMDVPVEVRNLTLVLVGNDGTEVPYGGITFDGHLTTRKGPTTFALHAPVGGGRIDLTGTATLFDGEGVLLAGDAIEIDSLLEIEALDAGENRDLLGLYLDAVPHAGVVDGNMKVNSVGRRANGDMELTLRGFAMDPTERTAAEGDDLRLTASFETDGKRFALRDALLRAEGFEATANVAGTKDAVDGRARLTGDLERSSAALRAMGVQVPHGVAGRFRGELTFRPDPSRGDGELVVEGLRAPPAEKGGTPLVVDFLKAQIALLPRDDVFEIESCAIEIPDEAVARLSGTVGHGGALDVRSTLHGDVPALTRRGKAMGLVPQDIAIAGTIDGSFALTRTEGDDVALLTIEHLDLKDEGVLVETSGTVRSDGGVHVEMRGEGALESLLAAGGAGKRLRTVRGTFSFAASADGPADAVAAELESLRIDGDLAVTAAGSRRPDGRLDGTATVSGSIPDAVALARGLGLVEGEIPLEGRIHADVAVAGPLERLEIPKATLRVDEGPLSIDAAGSVSELGTLEGTLEASADIDALLSVAHAQGFLAREHVAGGAVRVSAVLAGTREAPEVLSASLTMDGPLALRADGTLGTDGDAHVRADVRGTLERLAGLLAAVQDTDTQPVAGSYEGALSLDGPWDDPQLRLQRLLVRSEGLTVDAGGSLRPGGTADLSASVRGPMEGAFAICHSLGLVPEISGSGTVDVSLDARVSGGDDDRVVTGSLSGALRDIALLRADAPDVVFTEERLALSVPAFRHALGPARDGVPQRPIEAELSTGSGVRLTARVSGGGEGGPLDVHANASGPIQPLLDASAVFTGAGAGLEIGGSFATQEPLVFVGDVGAGREHAATWTGGTVLALTDVVAPHVAISSGTIHAKISKGLVHLEPVDLKVNGGTAQATGVLGLAGEKPEHRLELHATGIRIDTDLAPLLARATPILAVGDAGDAGGKAGIDVELTAKGLDADRLKKTISGDGVLHLEGVYAESRNWIGKLMDLAGAGSRLEVLSADVPFTVKRGKVTTEPLDMAGSGMALRLGGTVGLDGSIDYAFGVKPSDASSSFGKYAKLLDDDGFLPLRLEGDLASPDLKLPSLGDAIKGGLGDLLDDVLGKDDDEDDELTEEERKKRRRERRKRRKEKEREQGGDGD
jgi:hypothetical protein